MFTHSNNSTFFKLLLKRYLFLSFLPLFSWCFFQSMLPFCMREVWVITACLALINTIASHYSDGQVAPDIETEFFHLQGDLYSLCQIKVKFTRIASDFQTPYT